ncbi:MAG: T9SS type A sorting domain-containing protein [Bacteroides sp.]|jgi:hypothetical protein|nr:T9SS type A sorting domain-containing protein [Bacteroides sp.]
MKTTIARHWLCLLLIMCYSAAFSQENLAMNDGPGNLNNAISLQDTLKGQQPELSKTPFPEKFNIYKNQTTCAIHVVAKDIEEGAYSIEITDLEGNRVFNEVVFLSRNHYKIIDTSNLPEEFYYLIIQSGAKRTKKKISI